MDVKKKDVSEIITNAFGMRYIYIYIYIYSVLEQTFPIFLGPTGLFTFILGVVGWRVERNIREFPMKY
jgi:hypothetical protein